MCSSDQITVSILSSFSGMLKFILLSSDRIIFSHTRCNENGDGRSRGSGRDTVLSPETLHGGTGRGPRKLQCEGRTTGCYHEGGLRGPLSLYCKFLVVEEIIDYCRHSTLVMPPEVTRHRDRGLHDTTRGSTVRTTPTVS